jgi:hypothetical protein
MHSVIPATFTDRSMNASCSPLKNWFGNITHFSPKKEILYIFEESFVFAASKVGDGAVGHIGFQFAPTSSSAVVVASIEKTMMMTKQAAMDNFSFLLLHSSIFCSVCVF